MYNHEPKNYLCPFCQIAKKEPTNLRSQEDSVIFRNKVLTIFISAKWWKRNPGSLIIIPNKHFENFYDLPDDIGQRVFLFSKKAALALKKAYRCDGTSLRQHNEPAGNQDIWHYHLHIFPRYKNDNLYQNHKDTYWPTSKQIQIYVKKLKKYFK